MDADRFAELAKMVERGGTLNAEERQLAKRYAVFFRMPRLSGNTPPDMNRRGRNGSTVSETATYPSTMEMAQHQPQVANDYSATMAMPAGIDMTHYDPSMFDPQNFPQLQQEFYDGSNDIDFGFSDFFGGYAWPPEMQMRHTTSDPRESPLASSRQP